MGAGYRARGPHDRTVERERLVLYAVHVTEGSVMAATKASERSGRTRHPAASTGSAARGGAGAGRAAKLVCERHMTRVDLPCLGTVTLPSRDQLAFVGGVGLLAVAGLVEWPVAAVLAAGHLLASNRSNRTLREFGEALEAA
jgi:hypothetical protein